ncbi:MAG: AI-2E family transporter [Anaerolineales bacterium]
MNRNVASNRVFFLIVFLILIVLAYFILKPFLNVIILALISIIVLKPLYARMLHVGIVKERPRLASSLTLILVFVLIVVPVYFLGKAMVGQLSIFVESIDLSAIESLKLGNTVETLVFDAQDTVESSTIVVVQAVADFGSSLLNIFIDAMIFVIIFITLMPEFDSTVTKVEEISPLGKEISQLYYKKTTAMISSLVKGMFVIAVLQGLIMGFFYWLAGMNLWFLFMIISMGLAVLPIVGISWLVLILSAIAILQGNPSSAVIILIGFYGVANWVDVALRPRLVSKDAYMNFALVLLGILGGIAWAGFLGLFYGPVIMLLLVTTVEIYSERFAKDDVSVIQDYLSQDEVTE